MSEKNTTLPLLVGLLCGCLALIGSSPAAAQAVDRVPGERSATSTKLAPQWKLRGYPATRVGRLRYEDVAIGRLLEMQRKNASRSIKPAQIGIARRAAGESVQTFLPALQWIALGRTGAVARIEIRSPDALALRVGLQADRLDDRVELRFAGSDDPSKVVAVMRGAEIKRLLDAQGVFWTPSTDGEAQAIEIFRPAGVRADAVRLQAPQLSHLLANSRNDFKIVEKIGESGGCNVDAVCRVAELGQAFVNAKNAVAHMQFVAGGVTYICTGTLLADTTPVTQVPYFYSANHCFANGNDGTPVPAQMQAVANTLNTFWNYESTACGNRVSAPVTQVAGGATYLYSDQNTDGMLLRLNNPAPAGAYFAGWDASPLPAASTVFAIHHPRGDSKKVSSGQQTESETHLNGVGWLSGTTEGGSSGSGLFTPGADGYALRGGLFGGNASCANTGSLSNAGNRDYYSKFDVVYPNIRSFIAADPLPREGARPLLPPRSRAASPSAGAAPEETRKSARERSERNDLR